MKVDDVSRKAIPLGNVFFPACLIAYEDESAAAATHYCCKYFEGIKIKRC